MTRDELIKEIHTLEEMNSKLMSVNPFLNMIGIVRIFKGVNNSSKRAPVLKKYNEVLSNLQSMESELSPRDFWGLRKRVMACKPQ